MMLKYNVSNGKVLRKVTINNNYNLKESSLGYDDKPNLKERLVIRRF